MCESLGNLVKPWGLRRRSAGSRGFTTNTTTPHNEANSHKSHTHCCGHFRSSRTGYVARNSAISCGLIGLRRKLRCVYIERAESREDVADGV